MSQQRVHFIVAVLSALLFYFPALAQEPERVSLDDAMLAEERKLKYEAGGHLGILLPNQVPGVTEITPQGGIRGAIRTGELVYVEFGANSGKGEGAEWNNLFVSLRGGVPLEGLLGIVFIGLDLQAYQAGGESKKTFGGGHVGGGVMAHVAGNVWFRTDMKFNVNPGTSMYIGAGFLFRWGSEGGAEN